MNYFVEIRSTARRTGRPLLVPLTDVGKYSGFRSCFAYDEATAERIREQGSTANLNGVPVYCDTLLVDFDNSDGSSLIAYLQEQGIGFEQWHSGGRSVHLHVPIMPVFGDWVPRACKLFLKQHAPDADVSFYHPAGQFRLPGTFHAKHPGRCKTLIATYPGRLLELSQPTGPAPVPKFSLDGESTREDLFLLLTQSKGEGHRSPYIWKLAVTAAEAGMSFDEALEHVHWWNERYCFPPRDELTIYRQCKSAYDHVARKQA